MLYVNGIQHHGPHMTLKMYLYIFLLFIMNFYFTVCQLAFNNWFFYTVYLVKPPGFDVSFSLLTLFVWVTDLSVLHWMVGVFMGYSANEGVLVYAMLGSILDGISFGLCNVICKGIPHHHMTCFLGDGGFSIIAGKIWTPLLRIFNIWTPPLRTLGIPSEDLWNLGSSYEDWQNLSIPTT